MRLASLAPAHAPKRRRSSISRVGLRCAAAGRAALARNFREQIFEALDSDLVEHPPFFLGGHSDIRHACCSSIIFS